ncbi:MAG TPA: heparan-alpha-glucosaminide N-acetyltransferase domain-containing protein [Bacteroidia bacterium]|nr:heparan-alpha-glucosaminide N-acetyltransferase domain-containing protein [Bacteroidia bacterium]
MTKLIRSSRIETIDLLRGVVMVIMALDHVRDYFALGSFFMDPTDLKITTPALFFTRFITHFCAPVFVFLTGTSAFLWGNTKTKSQLFKFLFTRGIWLIFLELTVNTFLWTFDITYSMIVMQVIWAIGLSMVVLSGLIFLPRKILLVVGIILIAFHNLLDSIVADGTGLGSFLWYLLHQQKIIQTGPQSLILIQYPVLPWIGVMVTGYCFGTLYAKGADVLLRRKVLLISGTVGLIMFFIFRGTNIYGDLSPWETQKDVVFTILSFFNVTKYPPSLSYVLVTLSPAMLFLLYMESVKNRVTDFFIVFGRVPLFYYFAHVFIIHIFALLGMALAGDDWQRMILTGTGFMEKSLADYGYPLWTVYLLWLAVVLMLYPFCKKYMIYKSDNNHKWWLSYL